MIDIRLIGMPVITQKFYYTAIRDTSIVDRKFKRCYMCNILPFHVVNIDMNDWSCFKHITKTRKNEMDSWVACYG